MLNWYRIEKILGRGGFGVIYLATDTNLELLVAIKEYIPSDIARRNEDSTVLPITEEHGDMYRWGLDRFIKEARNLVRFKHPNIVRVMSVFQENNTAYMVMEFEEGEDLRRHLKRTGSTTEAAIKKLIEPISEGLAEVHRHGFIHRDIKPANILVRKDGSPVLLDFGSARNASNSGPDGLTALVTIGYAPLEQYASENDEQQGPWTDIYAMGGVLYYAISGNDPVDCTKRGTALYNGGRDPQPSAATIGREHYSAEFLNAIDWSLQLRISDRPQDLDEWVPALMGEVSIGPAATTESDFSNGDLTDTIVYTGDRHRGRTTGWQRRAQASDSGQASARRNSQRLSGRASRPVSEPVSGRMSGHVSGRASGQVSGRPSRPVSGRVSARDSAQISGRASKRFVEPEEPLTLSGVSHKRNKQGFAANGQEKVARPASVPLYEAPQRTSRTGGVKPPRAARKRPRKKISPAWFAVAAVLPLSAGLAVLYQRQVDETVVDTAKISESQPAITVATNSVPDTAAKDVAVPASSSDNENDSAAKAEAARLEKEEKRRIADEELRQKRAAQRAAAAERALEADKARTEDEKRKAIADNELKLKPAGSSNVGTDKEVASGTLSGGTTSTGGDARVDSDARPIERIAQRVTRPGTTSPEAPRAGDNNSATSRSADKSGSKAAAGAGAATTIVAEKIVKDAAKTASAATAAAGASVSAADKAASNSANSRAKAQAGAQADASKATDKASDVKKISVSEDSIVARAEIQTPVDVETAEEIASREIQRAEAARLKEQKRQAEARRTARAEKQRQLRATFDTAIRKGTVFLEQGLLDQAGAQVEIAESTGISNDTLRNLKKRLSNLVMDARRPVSDEDFDGVMTRFDDLRRAIENKDLPAIERLVRGDTQSQLFIQLLERFEKLDIDIKNIVVRNADKSISATLSIKQMVRANGDVATPSDAYRERIITSQRLNGEWSKIRW